MSKVGSTFRRGRIPDFHRTLKEFDQERRGYKNEPMPSQKLLDSITKIVNGVKLFMKSLFYRPTKGWLKMRRS